jgi:hypothetical protein
MNPRETLRVVTATIQKADAVNLSPRHFIEKRASLDGEDADIPLPLVEATVVSNIRARQHNTDLVGYVKDEAGNRVGEKYDATFEMTFQLSVWTPAGGKDPEELMSKMRSELRRREEMGPGEPFLDPDGNKAEGIEYFSLLDSEPDNDLSFSPNLYRTLQEAEIWFRDRIETTDPTIKKVDTPEDGEMTSDIDDTVIEYRA